MALTEPGEHPFAYLRKRADVLKCCGEQRNLVVQTDKVQRTQLAICKVCGRKHRKMYAEKGTMFEKGVALMAQKREARRGLILPGDPAFKV